MIKKLKNMRITSKFILWFLFIAIAPLAVATYVSYNSSRRALEDEVSNVLIAVADNKAHQIEAYLSKKKENVATLSHMSDVIYAFESFKEAADSAGADSFEYKTVDKKFRPFLEYYEKSFGYENLYLINPNGDIVFSGEEIKGPKSLYEIALYKDSELADVFIRVKDSLETEISNFEYYPRTREAAAFIASPAFKGSELIGFTILQVSNKDVFEFAQEYRGLGETGETIIASKIGNEAVFIAPLRFDPQAAFKRRITIGLPEGKDVQKAVKGEEGLGICVDYRGKETLAVWRYLPSFRLGMIVKMDTAEIFSSAAELKDILSIISLGLLALVVIMAVLIARSIAGPIKKLTETSVTIAGGELSVRAELDSRDEIGDLARSFNKMTDSLVSAKANVEKQKRMLEKVNKELDSFVYTASHDLRAPLRGISSFASFLEEDYKNKLDKEGRDYLREIREGASRMNQLIEDLLMLSRISRIKNPYEDVDMNALIGSVRKRIEFDIKEKKVDLRIQKDMPAVKCDRIKMSEVFLNLMNNAIKFSSKNNKETARVEVGYIGESEYHKFYVKDNGIGIDPKYHQQVFGIFKRLHTSSEYEGTGAGLSIVKRVIEDHGGRIWIESKPGKGAAFFFTIPKDLKEKG